MSERVTIEKTNNGYILSSRDMMGYHTHVFSTIEKAFEYTAMLFNRKNYHADEGWKVTMDWVSKRNDS